MRRLGAEVVQGDLTDLASMHRAIERCACIYSASAAKGPAEDKIEFEALGAHWLTHA
jgi:hypothetical protein